MADLLALLLLLAAYVLSFGLGLLTTVDSAPRPTCGCPATTHLRVMRPELDGEAR